MYHLAVEALNNVQKHARAETVTVTVCQSAKQLQLTIQDDGRGFHYDASLSHAIETGHIGLHSMKERAAEFDGAMCVISAPGKGTEVRFAFPIEILAIGDARSDTQEADEERALAGIAG